MKKVLVFGLFIMVLLVSGALKEQRVKSANLSEVSITLSTPRLSFFGRLDANNTVGSSLVSINTTPGVAPSTTSAQLAEGDSVLIGDGGTATVYTVASASATASRFSIKSPSAAALGSGDTEAGDVVVSTQSATHTVRFTTASAIPNGAFRILVPASGTWVANDGLPDDDGFDFGNSAPTVTCPTDLSGYDFVTGTATASAVTLSGNDYHAYECAYSGSGGNGTDFDGVTNDAITIDSIINPSPRSTHVEGYADTYKIIVQHLDSTYVEVDATTVSVGVIEAVRVTATVPPQITFAILGVASGTSACGVNTDVTTSATTVPFGEISISNFTDAAQGLTVSTNANNGYVVTAQANDQLGKDGQTCTGDAASGTCIPDSSGDTSTMTHTTPDEWNVSSNKGFAFSLHDINTSTTEAFSYDSTAGGCDGTFCARQFADSEDGQAPQTLFSSTTVADNENLYVCYRIVVSSTQEAGNYENYVTYRATATF